MLPSKINGLVRFNKGYINTLSALFSSYFFLSKKSKISEKEDIVAEKVLREKREKSVSPSKPRDGLPSATVTIEKEDSIDRISLLAEVASQARDISKDEHKKMKEKLPRVELIKLSPEEISDARKKALEDGETVVKVRNEDSSEMVDVESQEEKEEVKPAKVSEIFYPFLSKGPYTGGKIENKIKN